MPRPLRTLLLTALVIGLIGTGAELILLGHHEDAWQYAPLVLIGFALLTLGAHAVRRDRMTVRTIQVTMLLFVAAGFLGVWLHYQGNSGFELEVDPTMLFWPLFKAAISGVTPVLAPGAMIQLGLIGLAWSFRHPATSRLPETRYPIPETRP